MVYRANRGIGCFVELKPYSFSHLDVRSSSISVTKIHGFHPSFSFKLYAI